MEMQTQKIQLKKFQNKKNKIKMRLKQILRI